MVRPRRRVRRGSGRAGGVLQPPDPWFLLPQDAIAQDEVFGAHTLHHRAIASTLAYAKPSEAAQAGIGLNGEDRRAGTST